MFVTSEVVYQHPFFSNLSERFVQSLLEHSSHRIFEVDEYLIQEGQPANEFYLLGYGKVSVETTTKTNETVSIQQIGEGEILGLSWLFAPYLWQFDARAIEPTRSLVFDARVLRSMCEQDHELAFQLMKRCGHELLGRLGVLRRNLADLHMNDKNQPFTHRMRHQPQQKANV